MDAITLELAKLFGRTGHAHRKLAGKFLERHGLHRGQPPLLFALSHKDHQTNSELAENLQVTPATITNMVKRMEKAGFVARERDTEDERIIRVGLTDQGRELTEVLHETMLEIHGIAFDGLSELELSWLHIVLDKMVVNLEEALDEGVDCRAPLNLK